MKNLPQINIGFYCFDLNVYDCNKEPLMTQNAYSQDVFYSF